MKRTILIVLTITVLLAAVAFGAAQETKQPLKQEIVKLNYVTPHEVIPLIRSFSSRDGRLDSSETQKIVTISDYPENVEKIMAAIKEIDVRPPDVLFSIQLVLASEDGAAKTDEALANDPIIKELKGFLKYKSFGLLDTSMVRGTNMRPSSVTLGPNGTYILELSPEAITADKAQSAKVFVRLKQIIGSYQDKVSSQTLIESSLTMKSGDKTVVGVSRTAGGDKGLILIIQTKVVG